MPNFEVEYVDGKKVTVEAATADHAKSKTRSTRRADLPSDTPASAPEVKVKRVTLLDDPPANRDARGARQE